MFTTGVEIYPDTLLIIFYLIYMKLCSFRIEYIFCD